MGAFDDLIPRPARPTGGAFDDLIPAQAPTAPMGAFDDLIPAPASAARGEDASPTVAPPAGPQPGQVADLSPALPSPALPLYAGQSPAPAVPVQPPMARLLDPEQRTLPPTGPLRLPDARLAPTAAQNVLGAAPALTADEFGGILESVRNGMALTAEQDAALRLRLPPDGVRALDEAQQVARQRPALPADSPLIPGGPALETFVDRAVRGATLNMLPSAQAPAAVPGAAALNTAREMQAAEREARHPVAALGGEVAGAVVPYVAGALALRSAQGAAAAGTSPAARSIARLLGPAAQEGNTASLVREGATLAAPIEFARKPEGAEQMTAGEELAARGTQAVIGAGLGAAGDALLMGVVVPLARRGGMLAKDFWAGLRDKRTAAALDAEARQAGFDGAESYVESATRTVTTPDGREIVVPDPAFLARLPGEPVSAGGEAAAEAASQAAGRQVLPAPEAPPAAEAVGMPSAPDAPTPEAPETLEAQWEAFVDGRKPGILLTPGEAAPDALPPGARVADIPGRGTLIYRDEATLAAAQAGRMGEALGYGIGEKPPGAATVVTARDADGRVVQDVVTDGRPEVVTAAEQAAGPQGTVQERTAQAALQEREWLTRAGEFDRLAEQANDAQVKALLRQEAQRARDRAAGSKPKLSTAERNRARLAPDFERDDLLTLVRKLGGLNVDSGDWRGYLNPVADRVPGLPNPEQTGGRGMRLDDLAQVLWEQGWIPEHNLRLVEDLLDRARTGEKLYHPHSDEAARLRLEAERDREAGMAAQAQSTDEDWTFDLPDAPVDRSATDFVLDDASGTVVPARPVTLDDLERIDAEQRAADDWFRREGAAGPAEQPGGLAGDGTLGVPDRAPGALQGRADNQPAPGDVAAGADRPRPAAGGQLDLAGVPVRNETAQALADRGRAVDARLSGGGREVPVDAGPGGLFSARARNLDLLDQGAQRSGAFDDLIPAPVREQPGAEPTAPAAERTLKAEPAAPADPLTPAQRRSYERLREAADFEPETLTPEQWGILDNLERKLTGAAEPAPVGRATRRPPTAAERSQLARDFDEGVSGAAADLEAQSGARPPATRTINVGGVQRPVTDSAGKLIHPTEEGVGNFWRGFGENVVTDAQGRPLRLYHGTADDIAAFDPEKIAARFPNSKGFYATSSTHGASIYADDVANAVNNFDPSSRFAAPVREGANVVPVYASIKNPLVVEGKFLTPESILDANGGRLVSDARAQGHDGVIVRRTVGDEYDSTVVVAFHPEQMKSAIGNDGTFGVSPNLVMAGERQPGRAVTDVQPVTQPRGPQVRYEPVDSLPTATRTVTTGEDVAHLAASLRRDAQETVLAVVTDDAGRVLRVARVSRGGVGSAPVDPRVAAGAATSTPGGRQVWFVHNHPTGDAAQSPADAELLGYLTDLLRGSGVDARGMVTVAPGGRAAVLEPGQAERAVTIPAGRRGEQVPVEERRLRGQPREAPVSADELHRALPADEGVMLFSGDGRPARWVPMSADDMRLLRRGEGGPSQRLMRAIDESNAERLAARVADGELGDAAAGNVRAFARQMGMADDGVLDAAGRSLGDGAGQATFYANPFLAGAKPVWRELVHAPGRAAVSGAAGAVGGATLSDAEPGSARWWFDVATGAAVGAGGMATLRTLGVTGKGAILDSYRARAGRWANDWLFGNLDVRDIKKRADLMRQVLDRQTAQVGKLLAERFTPTERAKMADLIEGRGIVRDFNAVHEQAAALEEYLTAAAERMKDLGMLPADLETGGYLHRYYAKHLGLDRAFREAKSQSLSASYSRARGMEEAFGAEYLSPGARTLADELAQVQKDIDQLGGAGGDLLDTDTKARLEPLLARRRELRRSELVEFVGTVDGKVQRFFFARDEVPRVPGEDGAVAAQLNRPRPGEMARPDRLPDIEGVADLSPTGRVWSPTGARRPGQQASDVLLHRDWTKAERERWGEITDAGYRYVRGMAEVSHDLAVATVFKTVADKAEWARAADPGPWLNPPAGKRRYKGKAWVKVPETRVGPRSPLKRYGALSGMYVRPDVWAALKRYGAPVFEMPKGKLTVPAGAALGAAYGAAAGPLGAFGGAVAGAGIGALASRELYRHWLAHWKAWKTVYNPVTHLNNTHSNVQMLLMAGYSPADLGDGMRHLWHGEQSATWREARDAGLFGTDFASTELGKEGGVDRTLLDLAEQLRQQSDVVDGVLVVDRMMRAKQWFIDSRQAVRDAQGPWQTGAELARAASVPALKGLKTTAKPVKALAKAAENLYRYEDNVFKMAVFSAARKRGMTPRQAVDEANTFYFDYRDVPDAVRFARDLPIGSPFITYTYKVIPAIARNVVQNPERVLALVAGYEAMNYAGYLTDGGQPGEYWATAAADEELSPPWEDGRSLWGARNTVRLPFIDGYRLALGRAHAAGNPFASDAGGRTVLATPDVLQGAWGPALYGSSPLAAVMDLLTNQDWKGKAIYDTGAPQAEQAKAMAVYLYQAWAPSNILTPGGYAQGKVLEGMANDVRQAQEEGRAPPVLAPFVDMANSLAADLGVQGFTGLDRGGNDIRTRDALLGSFGVKVRPVRAEDSLDIELSKLRKEMSEHKTWIRRQGKLLGEGRITDAQYDRDLAQYDGMIEKLGRRQDRLLDAMDRLRASGVTVQEGE